MHPWRQSVREKATPRENPTHADERMSRAKKGCEGARQTNVQGYGAARHGDPYPPFVRADAWLRLRSVGTRPSMGCPRSQTTTLALCRPYRRQSDRVCRRCPRSTLRRKWDGTCYPATYGTRGCLAYDASTLTCATACPSCPRRWRRAWTARVLRAPWRERRGTRRR